jgi:transposase
MEWSPPAFHTGVAMRHDESPFHFHQIEGQEETMSQITTIGLDTSKHVFHVVGINPAGKVGVRKQLRRAQLLGYFAQRPASVVGLEACGGSHHWARQLQALGHTVRLVPARDVQALVRGQKNDYHDALAIAEAVRRPEQRFVAIKSEPEHDLQALQRLRRGYIRERTALSNRLRGLLMEYGIVMARGLATLRRRVPELLEDADNTLSDALRAALHAALAHLQRLDELIAQGDRQLQAQVRRDAVAQRLLTIPGFGPIVASTWRARLGDCRQFRRGRDAAAACGLVPRQHSTGGKPLLLGITKQGDKELRCLLVHGARAVISQAHKKADPLSRWACQVQARRGRHKATVALANKMARIAWAVTVNDCAYKPPLSH